jgi:hypothetical protein
MKRTISILAALAVAVSIAILVTDRRDGAGPPASLAPPSPEPAEGARPVPAPAKTRPPAPQRMAAASVASRPRAGPRRGVRGRVASTRVLLEDGEYGIDAAGWEVRVFALVRSRVRNAVDRIGIASRDVPGGIHGEFELDLPAGPHLVLVQHRAPRPGASSVLEAWYAYAEVRASDSALLDLGRHRFASVAVEGVVLGAGREPVAAAEVDFTDEAKDPDDPLPRGVYLRSASSDRGEFAFSIARPDGSPVVGRLVARAGGREAARADARPGDWVELVLAPPRESAEVTLEAPWAPGLRLWVSSETRRLAFTVDPGRTPAEVVREVRVLPWGKYRAEVFRQAVGGALEWGVASFEVPEAPSTRIRLDPPFGPARTITGRTRPGARVDWIARAGEGRPVVRDSVVADREGRFALRGLPTIECLLACGSALHPVPPGREPEIDVGELRFE